MYRRKKDLLRFVRSGQPMTVRQQVYLAAQLSIPSIFAQISSVIMQYIDASMVGSLGANASACLYDYVVVHGIMYICGRWICRAGGASSRCQRRQGSSRGIASGACFILTFRFFVGRHRLRYQRIFTPLARWR